MLNSKMWEPAEFEKEWIKIAEEIIRKLLENPIIQEIKQKVRQQGHVTIEDRDQFIELVNKIKYDCIYAKYGAPDSEEYKTFEEAWRNWQKLKGTARPQGENMFEDNINHLLYGSTPDPDRFLKDFDISQIYISQLKLSFVLTYNLKLTTLVGHRFQEFRVNLEETTQKGFSPPTSAVRTSPFSEEVLVRGNPVPRTLKIDFELLEYRWILTSVRKVDFRYNKFLK